MTNGTVKFAQTYRTSCAAGKINVITWAIVCPSRIPKTIEGSASLSATSTERRYGWEGVPGDIVDGSGCSKPCA